MQADDELGRQIFAGNIAREVNAPCDIFCLFKPQLAKRDFDFGRPSVWIVFGAGDPIAIPIAVIGSPLVGEHQIALRPKGIDREKEAILPIIVRVEQDLNIVIAADFGISSHVVCDKLRGVRDEAFKAKVDALVRVDNPHDCLFGARHPVVWVALYKTPDRRCL